MANWYSIYNYATNRHDFKGDDFDTFVKKFRNQAKKGRKVAKYMVAKANGKTYYKVFIQ